MRPKVIVSNKDQDPVAVGKLGDTFLGHDWGIQEDIIVLKFNVNMSKKKHGVRTSPSITKETLFKLEKADLTRRMVTGVPTLQYDPLGLNSPRTIQYKSY